MIRLGMRKTGMNDSDSASLSPAADVWTYIPNYLSIDSDCEIPEARPDTDTVQPICGHLVVLVFAQII